MKKSLLTCNTSFPYPSLREIDETWIPLEQFVEENSLSDAHDEELFFRAIDTAVEGLSGSRKLIVMTENSAGVLCLNPLLCPGILDFFKRAETAGNGNTRYKADGGTFGTRGVPCEPDAV
ncbi:MAG: hypothetical protein K5657_05615 [Desulfovibrio sp.]|nr:hypothetical protein [Desulfovibrio sp.]